MVLKQKKVSQENWIKTEVHFRKKNGLQPDLLTLWYPQYKTNKKKSLGLYGETKTLLEKTFKIKKCKQNVTKRSKKFGV